MERASAGISMNFVEIMLGEKLKDADSALDIMGSDRKVLQVACQDFTNYLKFHWNLIGKEANQCELVEKLEKLFKEDASELDAFLTVWTGIWVKKWKERVKLLIGNAGAVSLNVNGRDLGAPGSDGQVIKVEFVPGDPTQTAA